MAVSHGAFNLDLAMEDLSKTLDYYEYSLLGDSVSGVILMGDPSMMQPVKDRVGNDLGLRAVDLNMAGAFGGGRGVAHTVDPLVHGVSLGAALGGVKGVG